MADDYERVLLVKPEVKVFRIPPKTTGRAYRASEWSLNAPDWACRLRLIAKGSECFIKLDEKSTGQFLGQCPIDKYPGTAIESVADSSRYFVLKLVNEQTNRTAFVGIGFEYRSDSFDLNVALQDHFKRFSKKRTSLEREGEANTCKELVLKNTSSGSNGNLFGRQFIDSLADKMMEKYGNDTDNRDVIDLSCMQVVKKRRRSVPVKYAPPKTAPLTDGKKRSKTITFTQQETINVMPSTASSVQVYQPPCTTISRIDDTTVSCAVSAKHFNRASISNQEYQIKELNELHKSLLQGDTEIADLLCCVVHSTMEESLCLTPQVPLSKLPPHSFPVFRFDKNRVPFFILVCKNPQIEESPSDLLNDLNHEIIEKSSLIYQLLLKHQSGESDQSVKNQLFEGIEQQKTLLLQYLKKLLQDDKEVKAARRNLEALYESVLPNPEIFDAIVQIDAHNKPLFKFFAFPKNAPFDLNDSLPNYDPTIHSYSKNIYELIYESSSSTAKAVAHSVNPRMLRM